MAAETLKEPSGEEQNRRIGYKVEKKTVDIHSLR